MAENIERLKEIYPEAFTEGKVDFEVLKQLLGGAIDERDQKYGLDWHGKRRARQLALTPSAGTLRPCPEDSVDWEKTQNLMIEGDNLEVLKLLQKSHAGKVKLDLYRPAVQYGQRLRLQGRFSGQHQKLFDAHRTNRFGRPEDFQQNRVFRTFPHRLAQHDVPSTQVGRNLLREDGAIFISIDEIEHGNLRKLCDEILAKRILWSRSCGKREP